MKLIKTIFAVALAALTVSCSNLVDDDDNSTAKTAAPGQAYISVNVTNQDNSARTLLPKIEIKNLVLTGAREGAAPTVLASADSLDEMSEKQIEVQTGSWAFTLSANVSGATYSGKALDSDGNEVESINVVSGSGTTLNFKLKPEDTVEKGTFDFTCNFTGTEGVTYSIEFEMLGPESIDVEDVLSPEQPYTFKYKNDIYAGTYELTLYFWTSNVNDLTAKSELLNTYKSIVRIEKGITTTAVIENYNLNDVYSITYDGYEKEAKDGVPVADTLDPTTSVMTLKFSRKGGTEGYITLPKLKNQKEKDGVLVDCMTFSGWYTSPDFANDTPIPDFDPNDSSKMQKIEVSENLSDITLYAKWLVNSTGKVYTPMDYNFNIAAEGLWSEKGKANTVTITPAVTRKEATGTPTALTCSPDGKLTFADGTEVSENELVTWTAKLYDENKSASADITPDGFTFSIPVQNFSENYTLKVTATYLGIAHDASFNYRVTDGVTSVSSATFDGSMAISGSKVFISGRNLGTIKSLIASDHEVTQKEWKDIMDISQEDINISNNINTQPRSIGDKYPVYYVNWYMAIAYCNKLSIADNKTPCYEVSGITDWTSLAYSSIPTTNDSTWNAVTCNFDADGWRLPTEAEWEYLARGGNLTTTGQTKYSGTDSVDELKNYAWYRDNSEIDGTLRPHEVCTKAPNGIGLYDMSGNENEWCWDRESDITESTPYSGAPSGYKRVYCGGGFSTSGSDCVLHYHHGIDPKSRASDVGFRVVRNAE